MTERPQDQKPPKQDGETSRSEFLEQSGHDNQRGHLNPTPELEIRECQTPEAADLSVSNNPVVWRGIGRDWTCTKTWTLAGLAQRLSGHRIRVRPTDNEIDVIFSNGGDSPYADRQLMPVDEYIKSITGASRDDRARPAYAGNISIEGDPSSSEWARKLLEDCPISAWSLKGELNEHQLWIGAAGQKSSIHSDPYDNLNVQIIGKKAFTLFAPDQHEHLYPECVHAHLWASRIDPESPDIERFPKFQRARGFAGELSPGDVLFIPKFWWHAFSATEASLNINRWIYTEQERHEYWHEQPSAKKFIDYDALLSLLEKRWEALNAQRKEQYRSLFEQLRSGILRLAAESRSAGSAGEGA